MKRTHPLPLGEAMTEGNWVRTRTITLLLASSLSLSGCNPKPTSPKQSFTPPPPAVLSNGSTGMRLGPLLLARGWSGEKLPQFESESYQKTGEEKITYIPEGGLGFLLEAEINSEWKVVGPVNPSIEVSAAPYSLKSKGLVTIANKKYNFSASATMEPRYDWAKYEIEIEGFSGRLRLDGFTPSQGGKLTETYTFTPEPVGPNVIAVAIEKRVKTLPTIQIESTDASDAAFVSNALWRLQTELPFDDRPFAPMGLTSELYGGHTFWDADVWMMPVFVLCAPDRAAALAKYRLNRAQQAAENYRIWVASGAPIGKGKLSTRQFESWGVKYPWESSVSGKETVPGPSQFEDHISGSVLHGLDLARSYGLADAAAVKQVGAGVAAFYRSRADEINPGEWGIRGTMSPDELHIGDNDLYTNLLAEWSNRTYGKPDWRAYRPRDATSLLTYDNDGLRSYKQAAAVLAIYPLQDQDAESQAGVMIKRFSEKVIKNGPAMSDSIHSLIWARLGESEKAYKFWRASWTPFVRGSILLFNEKRNSNMDRTYFYTGAAGCLQTVLYGFAGIRLDNAPQANSKWTVKLKSGKFLSILPHLPSEWKSITLDKFVIEDKTYRFEIQPNNVKVQLTSGTSGTN
ncbi:MAG: hypothetical protein K8R88_02055 [Armatimonadetes bacterium]|nr:hypothetical protein [Armatimonadota bacterium]